MQTGIRDSGDLIWTSAAEVMSMFLAAIPKIIGFAVVLITGCLIVSLIKKGIAALMLKVRFYDLVKRCGCGDFVDKLRAKADSAGFIVLIMLIAVFNTLGLPAASDLPGQLLLRLPNLVAALVYLVIGGLAAEALSSLVRGAFSRDELGIPIWRGRLSTPPSGRFPSLLR